MPCQLGGRYFEMNFKYEKKFIIMLQIQLKTIEIKRSSKRGTSFT